MKKAVLVGINYENDPNARLYGCINDINSMGDILTDAFGYRSENITKLRDDTTSASFLPTKSNILSSLSNLVRDSANCAEIWFHYSGHGSQIIDRNGDESDGRDEVIVPLDYNKNGVIVDDEIFNILRSSRCKTILVFDSCNSGTVCDLQWKFDYVNNRQVKVLNTSQRVLSNPNIICFSGARDDQTAADSYNKDKRQCIGAFTDAFLACLRNSNINIEAVRLHTDICAYLQRTGFSQRSTLSTSSATPSYVFKRTGTLGEPARASMPIVNSSVVNSRIATMNLNLKPQSVNMNIKHVFAETHPTPNTPRHDLRMRFIF